MKLTKYAHACALIEKDSCNLLIDPGALTELPSDLPKIDVLIITHQHTDHFDKSKVEKIIADNPDVQIFTTQEVASAITASHVTVPEADKDYNAGNFTLKFYGGQHAVIHKDIPIIDNYGVCIDGAVYYPGDSFSLGPSGVSVLLAPAAAPWMKISEAIDFVTNQTAKLVIPTHDAIISDAGKNIADTMLGSYTDKYGGTYRRLTSGESINI